jgi:hypothetical protein
MWTVPQGHWIIQVNCNTKVIEPYMWTVPQGHWATHVNCTTKVIETFMWTVTLRSLKHACELYHKVNKPYIWTVPLRLLNHTRKLYHWWWPCDGRNAFGWVTIVCLCEKAVTIKYKVEDSFYLTPSVPKCLCALNSSFVTPPFFQLNTASEL